MNEQPRICQICRDVLTVFTAQLASTFLTSGYLVAKMLDFAEVRGFRMPLDGLPTSLIDSQTRQAQASAIACFI